MARKRPPKSWWNDCVRKVRRSRAARSAERVCGALWARKMTPASKAKAKKRHPESDYYVVHPSGTRLGPMSKASAKRTLQGWGSYGRQIGVRMERA